MTTQAAAAPVDATATLTTAKTPRRRGEKKVTWHVRQIKRLSRIQEELTKVQESVGVIEPRQAEKAKLNLPQVNQDLIDANDSLESLKMQLGALGKNFFPKARKRVLNVYEPGEKMVLRTPAPSTYLAVIGQNEELTIVEAQKQTLQLRAQSGQIVVGLASHFRRVVPVTAADAPAA